MRFRAKNCMESGGETFYIKKETTAQSSNLESCVTTRTVDISGLRFQPSPRFFAREKGQVGKWSGEGEEENQDFCEDRGWSPLPSNLIVEFQDGGIPRLHRICARRYGVHYALEKACNIICMPFAYDLHIIFNERTRSSRFLPRKKLLFLHLSKIRFLEFRNSYEISHFSN